MVVISVGGVQGTGKTTLARQLVRSLDAMLLSRGPLMEAIARADEARKETDISDRLEAIGTLAYDLITTLLQEQVGIGQSVVVDCGVENGLREQWRQMTQEAGGAFFIIDTVCSDVTRHRERFETRGPTWSGEIGQTWDSLNEVRSVFQPHPDAFFIADSVLPVSENVDSILTLLGEFGLKHPIRCSGSQLPVGHVDIRAASSTRFERDDASPRREQTTQLLSAVTIEPPGTLEKGPFA